jgi:hypothetical protein
MWDHLGRNIGHPRHYAITGYDMNGDPQIPWLDEETFQDFQKSGKSWGEFSKTAALPADSLPGRQPAAALTQRGTVAQDCRWLKAYAPQCAGWLNLTERGGSGSFESTWDGFDKLTSVAAIPYYTGQYSPEAAGNRRGFGMVTISASLDDFYGPAITSRKHMTDMILAADNRIQGYGSSAVAELRDDMLATMK